MIDPYAQITIAGCTHGPDDVIDVTKVEYNLITKEWWVNTSENLKVPHRFPFVVIMGKGRGATLEDAMADAAEDHLQKKAERIKEAGLV